MNKTILQRLTSRKFMVSVISIICGVLGIINVEDNLIAQVGSILAAVIPAAVYIITEGSIDKAAIAKTLKQVSDIMDSEASGE